MENKWKSRLTSKQILTIPNILSFVRLALIPLMAWLYCVKEYYGWTLIVVIVSGATDVVDGFIARKLNMVTDFGKALDPIADKLTQCVLLICLISRFPLMLLPLCLMIIKEIVAFVLRLIIFEKTESVYSAEWHGKLNTVVLYLMMLLHIIWYQIPEIVSIISIIVSTVIMALSFVLYTVSNVLVLKKNKESRENYERIL